MSAAVARLTDEAHAGAADLQRPIDVAVYEIHGGRVRRGTLRTPLPRADTRFISDHRMPYADETLAAVRAVATRCAPWLRVYVGPALWAVAAPGEDVSAFPEIRRLRDGRIAYRLGGFSWGGADAVAVMRRCSTAQSCRILHHEIWHAVEYRLARSDFAVVDRAVSRGVSLPGVYLDSNSERRARLYESWSSAWDEGWRPVAFGGWPVLRLDRIFRYVYSGGMAADIARHGAAREMIGPLGRVLRAARAVYQAVWC